MEKIEKVLIQWFPNGNQGRTEEIGVFELKVTTGPQSLTTFNGCESQWFMERECHTVNLIGKKWLLRPLTQFQPYDGVKWELSLAKAHGEAFKAGICPHCNRILAK